jgi:FdrA protein
MSTPTVRVRRETYVDSVLLMKATREMKKADGVDWAAAVMGTPANRDMLISRGCDANELAGTGANDLVLAVSADTGELAEGALAAGEGVALAAVERGEPGARGEMVREIRTLDEAREALPGANVALVSTPGPFAVLEAHKALSARMHVLLFSDNVPIEDEIALKRRAAELGLLVMGPGAGTAALGGIGLGFANAVRPGFVGVVAAAGTGAQEVMSLIHRWGGGIRHVIGIGGRDLSERVGGSMAATALRAVAGDPMVEVVLFVSKPPSPEVAASLIDGLGPKPTIVAMIGLAEAPPAPEGVRFARTLDEAAARTVEALGRPRPEPSAGLVEAARAAIERLPERRRVVRGLFSGGTLCYESMVVLSDRLGEVRSNTPLRQGWGLPAPPGSHVCLDLGEEEYTRGRPHPMIDPEGRAELIRSEGSDPDVAVVLLDVVLGHGSHDDPAGILAPACADVTGRPDGPVVVAYVLGTDLDPQGLEGQRARLAEAGCVLAPTGARSALLAAAIAARRPEVAAELP